MSFKNFDKEKHKMTTLTFQNTTLSVINQNNQTFLTASDLGKALDYSDADRSVRRLYTANADEFTAGMTALIEMPTAGGIQKVRIFSLRGAHLIAMFARTKVAKDFRKWVLDILDREVSQNTQQNLPLEQTFNFELKNSEVVSLAWLWFSAHRMVKFIELIEPALKTLGSNLEPSAHSMGVEYGRHIKHIGKLIHHLSKDADFGLNSRPFTELVAEMQHQQTKRLR